MNGDTFKFTMIGDDQLTRPLRNAENQMKRLGNEVNRTNKQMGAFSSNLANAGRGSRAFAMGGLQQAGYQIGDFAVQVANGTSKMQAFGQQAPQFLQIFGPIGSVIGAAVAVVAAFGVAAQKSSGASASMADKVNGLKSSIDSLKGVDEMLRESLEAPILAANTALTAYLTQLREAKLEEVIGNVRGVGNEMIAPLIERMERLNSTAARTRENVISMMQSGDDPAAIQRLIDRISKQEKIADTLKEMATTIAMGTVAKDTEELAQNLLDARQTLEEQGLLTSELSSGFDQMLEKGGLLAIAYQKQKALTLEINKGIEATRVKYVDILGTEEGLALAVKANNELYAERLRLKDEEYKKNRDNFMIEASVLVQEQKIAELRKAWAKKKAELNKDTVTRAKTFREEIIKLSPELKRAQDLADSVGNSFENAMLSAVDGTMKAKDAFRVMAADIIKELYRVFVIKKITGFITDAITFAAGPKTGNTGSLGLPDFSYDGGGYTGNGARAGGMDGKGGFMAMLHPRETVVDHTRGQGGGVTVVQNINVSTGVQQTVRTEIKSLMPQIAESAKAAVADAKRRGGSYGRAFA